MLLFALSVGNNYPPVVCAIFVVLTLLLHECAIHETQS